MPYGPGGPASFSAGIGVCRGEFAAAIGVSRYVRENMRFSLGASFASNGGAMARAGVSFSIGI